MADTEQGDNPLATPTSTEATTPPASTATETKPEVKQAEQLADLVASISKGEIPEPPVPALASPPTPPTGANTATATGGEPTADSAVKPATEAKAPEQPATAVDLPDVHHPYDQPDDPKLDDIDAKERTRERFDAMRSRLRDARQQGEFGRQIHEVAAKGGLTPDDFAGWVHLGVNLNKGDPEAIRFLRSKLDEWDPQGATHTKQQDTTGDDRAQAIYDEVIASRVESLDMTEAEGKALAKKLAEREQKALSQSQTRQTPTQAPPQRQPMQQPVHPAQSRLDELDRKFEESYRKTGRDYDPIRKEASKIIQDKSRASGPIPPQYWEYEWSQAVRQAIAKATPAAPQKQPGSAPTSLRPSTHQAPVAPGKMDLKDIAGAITSGDLSKLSL